MEIPQDGDDGVQFGPAPPPAAILLGGIDDDLGVLKSGKEGRVRVIRRTRGPDQCLLAVKVYRPRPCEHFVRMRHTRRAATFAMPERAAPSATALRTVNAHASTHGRPARWRS